MKYLLIAVLFGISFISCSSMATPSIITPTPINSELTITESPPSISPATIVMGSRTQVEVEITHPALSITTYDSSLPIEIAFLFSNTNYIMFTDSHGNLVKLIHFDDLAPMQFDWIAESCKVQITTTDSRKIKLWKLNFGSNEIINLFEGSDFSDGEWITWPKISPSQKFVSYVIWSGERTYPLWEFRDIEMIDLNDPESDPARITQYRKAGKVGGVWAPKSDILAFNDSDIFGRQQLFLWDPIENLRTQVTNFDSSYLTLRSIRWSIDEGLIAFVAYSDRGDYYDRYLIIVSINGELEVMTDLGESQYFADHTLIFNDQNNQVMISKESNNLENDGLLWVDIMTGEVVSEFSSEDELGFTLFAPFSISSNEVIGFIGEGGDFYFYDNNKKEIGLWALGENIIPNTDNNRSSDLRKVYRSEFKSVIVDDCTN